jgi:PQQ-like domain
MHGQIRRFTSQQPRQIWSRLCILVFILSLGGLQSIKTESNGNEPIARGDWSTTIAAVVLNNRLYTVERSGALYGTDLSTGKWVKIGKPEFGKTKFLFAGGQSLLTIETDGSLYRISPVDGSWLRVGQAGAWKGTNAGAFIDGRLYTADADGAMYATDPSSGTWTKVGKAEFAKTRSLLNTADSLYSFEDDGSIYWINPSNGVWRRVGEAGGWKNAIARTTLGGKIYTIESSGVLYETNPNTGTWKQIGKAEFAKTRYLFSANASLYTLEDGGLYHIDPVTGSWVAVE